MPRWGYWLVDKPDPEEIAEAGWRPAARPGLPAPMTQRAIDPTRLSLPPGRYILSRRRRRESVS